MQLSVAVDTDSLAILGITMSRTPIHEGVMRRPSFDKRTAMSMRLSASWTERTMQSRSIDSSWKTCTQKR